MSGPPRLPDAELRALLEGHPDPVVVVVRGRIAACSSVIAEALGRSMDEVIGMSPLDFVHPDERERIAGRMDEVLGGAPSQRGVYRAINRDGEVVHLEIASTPVRFGGEAALLSSVRDVTGRARAEDALRKSESRLRDAQRIAHVGTWEWDAVSNGYWVSDELFRIFALQPNEAEDMREAFLDRVHPGDRPALDAANHAAVREGQPYDLHYRIVTADGAERLVHSRAEVDRGPDGRLLRVIGTIQDVTERVKLEKRLQQLEKLEAIGRLAGGVAHDFNNLLTVIRGHAELLLSTERMEDRRAALEKIMEGAEMGSSLTRELLTFGRQDVREPRAILLDEVVERIRQILDRTLPADVDLHVATALAGVATELDPVHAEQVLLNLALNARDAMADGGGTLTIRTDLQGPPDREQPWKQATPGHWVRLSVSDTGHGIPPDLTSRIFEPYFTTKGMGSGLGLATVFGVVEDAGGMVEVESEPGAGTTFCVYLPAAASATGDAVGSRGDSGPDGEPNGASCLVLVAEDNDRVRQLVTEVLESSGYEVVSAEDGATALEALRTTRRQVDLLVTDVMMPGMGGPELCDRARELEPGLPVVFISGYGEENVLHRGEPTGPEVFLPKPFSPVELLRNVTRLLGARTPTGR